MIKLRSATVQDEYKLWQLRCDPEIDAQFFGEAPELVEHRKWLMVVFASRKITLLIVEIDGIFAGQVRLDDKDDTVTISISLTLEYRGHGLGSEIVLKALEHTDKDVIALIKRGNIASLKTFARSGFGAITEEVSDKLEDIGDCCEEREQ